MADRDEAVSSRGEAEEGNRAIAALGRLPRSFGRARFAVRGRIELLDAIRADRGQPAMRRHMDQPDGGGDAVRPPRDRRQPLHRIAVRIERAVAKPAGRVALDRFDLAATPIDPSQAATPFTGIEADEDRLRGDVDGGGDKGLDRPRCSWSAAGRACVRSMKRRLVRRYGPSGVQASATGSSSSRATARSACHCPPCRRRSVQIRARSAAPVSASGSPPWTQASSTGSPRSWRVSDCSPSARLSSR